MCLYMHMHYAYAYAIAKEATNQYVEFFFPVSFVVASNLFISGPDWFGNISRCAWRASIPRGFILQKL